MRKFATCAALALLGGSLASAGLNHESVSRKMDRSNLDTDFKLRQGTASKVINTMTGEVIPQDNVRVATVALDNIPEPTNVFPIPGVFNASWVYFSLIDGDPNATLPLCNMSDYDPNFASDNDNDGAYDRFMLGFFDHPLGGDNCVDNGAGFAAYMVYFGDCVNEDNKDISWDDYLMDSAATEVDPNQLSTVIRHDFIWDMDGTDAERAYLVGDSIRQNIGYFDLFDFDGNTIADQLGGFSVDFVYDAAASDLNTRYNVSLGAGVSAYGAGLWLNDTRDLTVGGLDACFTDSPISGGFEGEADPDCDPDFHYTVGGRSVAAFFVVLTGAQNGTAQDPNDPNVTICTGPIDPNIDGAPGLSYADIFTGGFGYNLNWYSCTRGSCAVTFNLSAVLPLSLTVDTGCTGDVDGDGDVDLDDLLLVLGSFEAGPGGDADGDGDTDLDDLLLVLGNFGCPLP
jgi:hypothetical protein